MLQQGLYRQLMECVSFHISTQVELPQTNIINNARLNAEKVGAGGHMPQFASTQITHAGSYGSTLRRVRSYHEICQFLAESPKSGFYF